MSCQSLGPHSLGSKTQGAPLILSNKLPVISHAIGLKNGLVQFPSSGQTPIRDVVSVTSDTSGINIGQSGSGGSSHVSG